MVRQPPCRAAADDEALRRLGIRTGPTRLEQAYGAGRTTQVPSGRRITVDKRVRRKIGYSGVLLSFERGRPSAPVSCPCYPILSGVNWEQEI